LDQTDAPVVTGTVSALPGGMATAKATYTLSHTVTVTNLDFGTIDPVFAWGTVTVTNPNAVAVGPLSVVTSGKTTAGLDIFGVSSDAKANQCSGATLQSGQSCQVQVFASLNLPDGQSYSATITVSGDNVIPAMAKINITTILNHGEIPLHVGGTGMGTIMTLGGPSICSSGGACGTLTVHNNSSVTLVAVPAAGSVFSGWMGGGCSGTATNCAVTVDNNASISVTATFDKQ
jgi:hypothetical protein